MKQLFNPNGPFVAMMKDTLDDLQNNLSRDVDGGGKERFWDQIKRTLKRAKNAALSPIDILDVKDMFSRLERHKSLILLAMQQDIA